MAEFSMVWNGDRVRDDVLTSATEALQRLAIQGEAAIREGAPVRTGFLRDSVYAFVDVTGGVGNRTPALIMGASAEYALFVILGTRFVPGRDFVTPVGLATVREISPALAQILAAKGYGGATTFGSAGPGLPNPYTGGGPLSNLLGAALSARPVTP